MWEILTERLKDELNEGQCYSFVCHLVMYHQFLHISFHTESFKPLESN